MTISLQADKYDQLWLGSYSGLSKKTVTGYEVYHQLKGKNLGYISVIHKTKSGQLFADSEAGVLQITEQGLR